MSLLPLIRSADFLNKCLSDRHRTLSHLSDVHRFPAKSFWLFGIFHKRCWVPVPRFLFHTSCIPEAAIGSWDTKLPETIFFLYCHFDSVVLLQYETDLSTRQPHPIGFHLPVQKSLYGQSPQLSSAVFAVVPFRLSAPGSSEIMFPVSAPSDGYLWSAPGYKIHKKTVTRSVYIPSAVKPHNVPEYIPVP